MEKFLFSSEYADYVLYQNKVDDNLPFTIFLHGGPGFNNLAEREILGKYYHDKLNVLWFDMLGCFEAPVKDPEFINLENTITDIVQIIDKFAGGSANLVGFCISTQVIHSIMKRHPDKVNKVIFFSPNNSLTDTSQNILSLVRDSGQLKLDENEVLMFDEFMKANDSTINPDLLKIFATLALKAENLFDLYWQNKEAMKQYFKCVEKAPLNIDVFLNIQMGHFADLPVDCNKLYRSKEVLVCGGENDRITRWEKNGKKIIDELPDAKYELILDVGHWIHFENAELTSKVVTDFILG